jgi:YD repeat-containing protein
VLEQTETQYDFDSNPIQVTTRERFHDETATGALGNPTTGPKARVSYAAMYYDKADPLIHSVDVGTYGGMAFTRPAIAPGHSNIALVTDYAYNAAGLVETVTDPKFIVSKTYYDALGRSIQTIEAYQNFMSVNLANKTVEYTYDPSGGIKTLKVDLSGGGQQTTEYVYGVTGAVSSNDILKEVHHPDPATGSPSSTQKESYTVNALGERLTAADRNGTTHEYSYDVLGRLTADVASALGMEVDGSVRRIEYAYDGQGNQYQVTSYNVPWGPGNIVNQVQRTFNGLGQMTAEYQSHSGAVNTSTTPVVQYAYSEMAGGANHSRLTSITDPGGAPVVYNYGTGLNNSISRLSSISDGFNTFESYDYLGLSTVVRRAHPQIGVDLTYIAQQDEGTGDAGDQYVGLDRFGRVVDQRWLKTDTGTATDRFQYGYDLDGNRTYRDNLVNTAFGELYTYDNLGQITSFKRGTLNGAKNGIVGTPSRTLSWNLDTVGNWNSLSTNGLTPATWTHNAQNEITSTNGLPGPMYDANGNERQGSQHLNYVYDAWNRLVAAQTSPTNVFASYEYDGLGRRVSETKSGTTRDFYYSDQWQVVEERVGGQAQVQYVWSPVYVDALVLRDRDADGNPWNGLEERLWVQQDANWNVTALVANNNFLNVVERYVYDPFGAVSIYNGIWQHSAWGSYDWHYLHQGLRYDYDTKLYDDRARAYDPAGGAIHLRRSDGLWGGGCQPVSVPRKQPGECGRPERSLGLGDQDIAHRRGQISTRLY